MSVASRIRAAWRALKRGQPGHRFQDRYARAAGVRHAQHFGWRLLKIVTGVLLLAVGVVEILLPGPAILFLFLGGALLATQSRAVARAMDWMELRARAGWAFVRRIARRGGHARALVLLAAPALTLLAADPPAGL